MTSQTTADSPRTMITRIWARNFKSIKELDLELGPLTVLVGPNASGKSNVLDILRFIQEALRGSLDSAIASRHGIGSVRRSTPRGGSRDVEVGFLAQASRGTVEHGFVLGSRSGNYRVKREYSVVTPSDSLQKAIAFEIKDGRILKPAGLAEGDFNTSELHLPFFMMGPFYSPRMKIEATEKQQLWAHRDFRNVRRYITASRFYRLFPDTMREPTKPGDATRLLEDGSNLGSMLRDMINRDAPFLNEIKEGMGVVVPGLTDLQVQQSGGFNIVKLRHGATDNGSQSSLFDLTQESDGTVRLLGLLTAFYQDYRRSLIGVEEPELTIHPGALAYLAEVMVEASYRTQVIATTHSPDLIDWLPIESLRAVEMRDGITKVGHVAEPQVETVKQGLFTAGELHSMDGLRPND